MKKIAKCEIDILIERYPSLNFIYDEVEKVIELLTKTYFSGGRLLVCGNGGSAADSMHIVGELMKSFVLRRKIPQTLQNELRRVAPENSDYYINNLEGSLSAVSLVSEISLTTAYSNDRVPDLIFAQQVLGHGRAGDTLLAISTSGNSVNVIHAINVAKAMNINVVGLTGESGGAMKALCDLLLAVPARETYQIQELHLPIYHTICLALEKEFFG